MWQIMRLILQFWCQILQNEFYSSFFLHMIMIILMLHTCVLRLQNIWTTLFDELRLNQSYYYDFVKLKNAFDLHFEVLFVHCVTVIISLMFSLSERWSEKKVNIIMLYSYVFSSLLRERNKFEIWDARAFVFLTNINNMNYIFSL